MEKKSTLSDLTFAIFKGASFTPSSDQDAKVAARNSKILRMFSEPIAQINRPHFKTMMGKKLEPDQMAIVKEIPDGE